MANTPVQNGTTNVDPMFYIPDGTVGMEYGPARSTAGAVGIADVDSEVGEEGETGVSTEGYIPEEGSPSALGTPQILSVISQTVRRGPGGYNVIDVVLEVEDIVGATNYEFRVAKV